jgi:hypothetical protein
MKVSTGQWNTCPCAGHNLQKIVNLNVNSKPQLRFKDAHHPWKQYNVTI